MRMIRSRGFRQIRARALPLLIVTALVPLAAGAGEGWVRIPLEGRFTALSLGQGGASAVVIEEVTGDAALVDTVSGSADRPEIRATQILAVLPLPEDAGHLVVGLTRKGDTAVSHLDPDTDGRQVPSRLIEVPVRVDGAALGQDLALYLRALDSPFIARLELCETDELEIEGCRERTSSGYGATIFEVPGPPAADLVADAASDIVIAVQHGTPEVVGLDARHGKTLFAQVFADLEPPLRLAGAIGGRATLFVSAPRSGSVEIFDIDRDFRELSPAGRIDLGALGDTPTPTISLDDFAGLEGSGSDPEAWWQLAGKVAVGPEQDVVLIAGLEPDTIHVIVRTRSTNRLALDLRSEQAEVLDFALSPDGGHFGILLDGLLIVSPVRALMALADSAGVGRSVDVNAAEKAITSALQTRLSQEGFYRGVVDGVWGPESQAALSRFQARNGIDTKPLRRPSEADAATLGALFADNLENLPVDAFGPERAQAAREAAFARFFARNLPRVRYFSPSEIFISGRGNAEAKCGALNALPDEELWPAILPAVRRLDVLRAALGKTIPDYP